MAGCKPDPLFALRSIKTTAIVGKSQPNPTSAAHDFKKQSRVIAFSDDGSLFAFCDIEGVKVYSTEDFQLSFSVPRPRTAGLKFSPVSTVIALWEPCQGTKGGDAPPPSASGPNLQMWNCKTKTMAGEFLQKKQQDWCPQWTKDEAICSRNVNNEILFYAENNFTAVSQKLHLQKVSNYRLAECNSSPYHVAVHVPGSKGQPSFVRLFQYPNFSTATSAIANKSFYKAEKAELTWNRKGTALLILTSTEASESSYYGEQGLHFVDVTGESCLVPRAKDGPIYHVAWSPDSRNFCVVYGYMPAKATLYNLKCEAIFDFGTGPRNLVYFNPHGNMLSLVGLGNLRGNIEIWDLAKDGQRKLTNPQAADSTTFEWCPDGEHFLTSTTAPRLRVGNGYKLWHYGNVEPLETWAADGELYDVLWRPSPDGVYPPPHIDVAALKTAAAKALPKPAAYVPPALRNQPQPASSANKPPKYREDYELPSNLKETENKPLSKAAIKNKKKREAKARKKQDQDKEGEEENDQEADN